MDERDGEVERHYDALADRWEEFTRSPWKEGLLWPAVRSLLPALGDARVLDVGCGNGHYSARLADRGADVLGVDLSEEMVRQARRQHGDSATFRQGDVTEGLDSVGGEEFDIVLCQHVLSHVPSVESAIGEFARVLQPEGTVVLSTHHPLHDYLVVREGEYPDASGLDGTAVDPAVKYAEDGPDYHATERFDIHWSGANSENPGTYYRRPLSALLQPLLDAGFDLEEVVEPAPDEALGDRLPDADADLADRPPRSLCLRARRSEC
ncbi:class I SAM-dependent methyltransferase [Halobacteriales archaeon QS_9_67_15]|nr:MAG: class I SAM-dependent methyltransferase [Halobacteriales archaeon QS_9_67_15]